MWFLKCRTRGAGCRHLYPYHQINSLHLCQHEMDFVRVKTKSNSVLVLKAVIIKHSFSDVIISKYTHQFCNTLKWRLSWGHFSWRRQEFIEMLLWLEEYLPHFTLISWNAEKTTLKDDVIRLSSPPRVSIILYYIIIIHLIPQIIHQIIMLLSNMEPTRTAKHVLGRCTTRKTCLTWCSNVWPWNLCQVKRTTRDSVLMEGLTL